MRVVFDTNVLLAGFGSRGFCESLLADTLNNHEVFVSQPILDEFEKYLVKFKVATDRVVQLVAYLELECTLVVPAEIAKNACRDPKDLMVLGTAIAANADVIVSGDKDLLTLKSFDTIPILSPREFYEKLK